MYLFVVKEMGGGICYFTKRLNKTNNKYMKSHDDKKPSTYITYLDVNNLYACAMSQCLLYSACKWLSPK